MKKLLAYLICLLMTISLVTMSSTNSIIHAESIKPDASNDFYNYYLPAENLDTYQDGGYLNDYEKGTYRVELADKFRKKLNNNSFTSFTGIDATGKETTWNTGDQLPNPDPHGMFNGKKVTSMSNMFSKCAANTLNLSNFDTSNVTKMGAMFSECKYVKKLDVSSFDTSKVTDFNDMFCECTELNTLNVSKFNTENAETMWQMFFDCEKLTDLNVSSFNTQKVTYMGNMFAYCKNLKSLDLSNFKTSNVINMETMFADCSALETLNVQSFDTSKVKNMYCMFSNCKSLSSLDLSSFDLADGANIGFMFNDTCRDSLFSTVQGFAKDEETANTFNNAEKTGIDTSKLKFVAKNIKPTDLEIDKPNKPLYVGTSYKLAVNVKPDHTTDKTISWISSNEDVATVKDGIVTPKKVGTCVITASCNAAPDIKDEVNITVNEKYDSHFTIKRDNNSFTNGKEEKGDGFYGISKYSMDDEYYKKLTANLDKTKEKEIQTATNHKWEGSCYGIATSMGLLYERKISLSDLTDSQNVSNYYSLQAPRNDKKLKNMIQYYQISQLLPGIDGITETAYNTNDINFSKKSIQELFKDMIDLLKKGHTVSFGFSYPAKKTKDGKTKWVIEGHQILVTGYEYDESTADSEKYKITCYDENSCRIDNDGKTNTMFLSEDLTEFKYVDANRVEISNNNYTSLDIVDLDKYASALNGSTKNTKRKNAVNSLNHAYISFKLDHDFKAVDENGKTLEYKDGKLSGDMKIYDANAIMQDEGSKMIVETEDLSSVKFSDCSEGIDVNIYNNDDFQSLSGENIKSAEITLNDGMKIEGDDYSYKAYLMTDKITDDEAGLVSISANAKDDVTLKASGKEVKATSDQTMTNIKTENLVGANVETNDVANTDTITAKASPILDKKITLSSDQTTIKTGDTTSVKATVEPDNASNKDLSWTSSDESVATVDQKGVVKGIKAGEVTITATAKDGTDVAGMITIKVSEPESPKDNTSADHSTDSNPSDQKTPSIPTPAPNEQTNEKKTQESSLPNPANKQANAIKAITNSMTNTKTDKDLSGSVYNKLQLKATKTSKSSVTIKWKKVAGTSKYLVFGAKKGSKYSLLTTTSAKSYTNKKLKKGTYYKYVIIAIDADGKKLSTSKVALVTTAGGKTKNPTGVKVNKSKVKLKKKKSFKIKAKLKGKKLKTYKKIAYESSNTKVATVSKSGKITAKKKGKATIYVYAQNGVSKTIKITVK